MPPHPPRYRRSATDSLLGQLFIIGFDGSEMSASLAALLRRVQPGGVVLFGRNIGNAVQSARLLQACRAEIDTPIFTCVDLEGGKVDRFRNVFGSAPAPAEVFATGNRKLFRRHGRLIGENCRALGFNIDFAPALDLAFEASRSVMSSRAVSDDPRQVVIYAREFLAGLGEANVLGCGKHFPGLGEGNLDSHHELPVIDKEWKKLWEQDLVPYRTLRTHLPFVMVSHAAYPRITKQSAPASISPTWITSVLRKKMGYRGLIVSDDLEMGGVLSAVPIEQAAVEHIRAGGDLALICHKEEGILRSYDAMVGEVECNRRFAVRAADSLRRIAQFKKKHARLLRPTPLPSEAKVERLSRRLWEFAEEVRLAAITTQEYA
jgi:beta-N-acetylhexosaminidase